MRWRSVIRRVGGLEDQQGHAGQVAGVIRRVGGLEGPRRLC